MNITKRIARNRQTANVDPSALGELGILDITFPDGEWTINGVTVAERSIVDLIEAGITAKVTPNYANINTLEAAREAFASRVDDFVNGVVRTRGDGGDPILVEKRRLVFVALNDASRYPEANAELVAAAQAAGLSPAKRGTGYAWTDAKGEQSIIDLIDAKLAAQKGKAAEALEAKATANVAERERLAAERERLNSEGADIKL